MKINTTKLGRVGKISYPLLTSVIPKVSPYKIVLVVGATSLLLLKRQEMKLCQIPQKMGK